MENKTVLNISCLLGLAIPHSVLALFILQHGPDLTLLIEQIVASPGSIFFALDVILCALFIIGLSITDVTIGNRRIYVIAAALLVGPSCAIPLYYRLRQV